MERLGNTSVQTFSNLFLKLLTEGVKIAEAGELIPLFHNSVLLQRSFRVPQTLFIPYSRGNVALNRRVGVHIREI